MEGLDRKRSIAWKVLAPCIATVLAWALLSSPALCEVNESSKGSGFEIKGEVLRQDANSSLGGSFRIENLRAEPSSGVEAREFKLTNEAGRRGQESNGCPCQWIFVDGFESGDVSAWSYSVGY